MKTLFLNPETWDLSVDAYGNIAVSESPYAIAQDVASACRLWLGEARYDTKRGIPYENSVLGQLPPASLLSEWYRREAVTVPEVASASVSLDYGVSERTLTGSITIKSVDGEENVIAI